METIRFLKLIGFFEKIGDRLVLNPLKENISDDIEPSDKQNDNKCGDISNGRINMRKHTLQSKQMDFAQSKIIRSYKIKNKIA